MREIAHFKVVISCVSGLPRAVQTTCNEDLLEFLIIERIGPRLAIGWALGAVVAALEVGLSLKIDLPTSAAIVCTFGLVLILMALFRGVIRRRVA